MNWSRLLLTKETYTTTAYKKVEWSATFHDVDGARFNAPLPTGGTSKKLGKGRAEIETQGAFAPEARGEWRISLGEFDLWGEGANDRFAMGSEDDALRINTDEPSIMRAGQAEIVFEKPRGKARNVFLGATRGGRFIGYLPVALATGGLLSFVFGSSALSPWFVPCSEPWGGSKYVAAAKLPPELGKALGDAEGWKRFEEQDGAFREAILASRAILTAMQYVRYG